MVDPDDPALDDPDAQGAGPVGDPEDVEVRLVPLRRRHLRSVMRIEAQVYPHPWTLPLFMSELALRSTRTYVGARVEGAVVGYAGLMYTGDESHVTTIAVDPRWHRHKIGSRMLAHLVRVSRERDVKHMTLEVRVANTGAQAMYRKFGFEPAGIRKNYYAETKEDALIMWVHDIDTDEYLARLVRIEAGFPGTTIVEDGRQ
ncbi:ribosomal protein S18-alanine N-acetyltransferase [Acidiferrimicrobium sp. IK]|uniref:ribosomal protein S18-alanine N-acetyltransferase n=1 Tax=Acidiferrimicrobium sp. IK TaxID=2871700 RepID=UPI0021CB856F|nr:ribosomal protein S18-alanine N-acetyltransferase [Acidiferrimicrobium sp. IK]MCU4184992.1 ribosomal protein S18-alanine N-acetyltransferase [Acidiferrimicrobium sp. IK]